MNPTVKPFINCYGISLRSAPKTPLRGTHARGRVTEGHDLAIQYLIDASRMKGKPQ